MKQGAGLCTPRALPAVISVAAPDYATMFCTWEGIYCSWTNALASLVWVPTSVMRLILLDPTFQRKWLERSHFVVTCSDCR